VQYYVFFVNWKSDEVNISPLNLSFELLVLFVNDSVLVLVLFVDSLHGIQKCTKH